jgi:glycerol kinase
MTADLILAIDQGTTNTKALLVDDAGRVVASASVKVPVTFPQPGWVESDALQLWGTVETAIAACLEGIDGTRVAAVAVANQRESVLVWDRTTGRPLGPVVSWQCRRSTDICEAIRDGGDEALVRSRTGLALDPMFSASKARWLLDHVADGDRRAERGELCVGTVDAWLAWNLSGGSAFVTDATNASRTLLLDLDRLAWDGALLDLFGVPEAALPTVRGSSAVVGTTQGLGRLRKDVPIAALIGDSHAALVGHGAPGPGSVKATFGTGTSVMAPLVAAARDEHLSATVAWSVERPDRAGAIEVVHALEGNITSPGRCRMPAASTWCRPSRAWVPPTGTRVPAACSVG